MEKWTSLIIGVNLIELNIEIIHFNIVSHACLDVTIKVGIWKIVIYDVEFLTWKLNYKCI